MKKDSPRRKIVDAIDFMTDGSNVHQVMDLSIEEIDEFSDHPFHLYEGKRLEDMVESIKTNGVLNPVIVRRTQNGRYEMLSGHNRMNASKLAGLSTVPAFVKDNLEDDDAYIYIIETNLMQRSFSDMYPSEKALVLDLRYKKITNQGRRTDIMRELQALEKGEQTPEDELGIDSRGRLAKEYGLSGRTMARLLRINKLIEDWKRAVDDNSVALMVGVELSYIPEDLQSFVFKDCEEMGVKLSLKDAKTLKAMHDHKELDASAVSKFLIKKEERIVKKKIYQSIKLPVEVMEKYFEESVSTKEVQSVVEKALEKYFEIRGVEV